jgi:Fe2+ transport system protein FeoA
VEGSTQPIAVVSLAHLEAVQSRLRELGITVDSSSLS